MVVFSDDGQGIDVEKVRQKALLAGLIKPEQDLEQQDILQNLFSIRVWAQQSKSLRFPDVV